SSTKDTINLNNSGDMNDVNIPDNHIMDSFVPNPIFRETEESITYNEINNLINSDNTA
ncbi:34025_t:CDS:1, partial [Gigaspora margarita]